MQTEAVFELYHQNINRKLVDDHYFLIRKIGFFLVTGKYTILTGKIHDSENMGTID
jgi:hypothetical protein